MKQQAIRRSTNTCIPPLVSSVALFIDPRTVSVPRISSRREITTEPTQDTMPIRQWTNLAMDDERYKQFVCPRHLPITCPSYRLDFPPEILIDIFIGMAADYLFCVFSSEMQDDEDIEARLAANPFLAFLRVSHQFRELAIKVSESSFGLRRNADGSLPQDAWDCLRYVFKHTHLLQRSTEETIEEHRKQGSRYAIPAVLKGHLDITKVACLGKDNLLRNAFKLLSPLNAKSEAKMSEHLGYSASVMFRPGHAQRVIAVVWCLQFYISMTPLSHMDHVTADHDLADIVMRASYGIFYMMHIEQGPGPKARWLEGEQSPPAIDVPVPETVGADLLNRYRFLSTLWRFQKCPVVAADQGLMKMSQTLLDRCLAITLPADRPSACKASRPRRASFSTVQDIRARPRPPLQPPCRCEHRLWIV